MLRTQAGFALTRAGNAFTSETNANLAKEAAETAQGLAETAQGLAEDAQEAAELALDAFDDVYLGSKASDPTLDNDGNPLVSGALYYNTTTNALKVYKGSSWATLTDSDAGGLLACQQPLRPHQCRHSAYKPRSWYCGYHSFF